MTISIKPQKKNTSEDKITQIIKKGGSVSLDHKEEDDDIIFRKSVSLKVDIEVLDKVDACVKKIRKKCYAYNRQQWIVDAIVEKLEKEQ